MTSDVDWLRPRTAPPGIIVPAFTVIAAVLSRSVTATIAGVWRRLGTTILDRGEPRHGLDA